MNLHRLVIAAIVVAVVLPAFAIGSNAAGSGYVSAPLPPNPGLALKRNNDGEPGIAVDGGGTFWIGSNVLFSDPRSEVVLTGEDIWKSSDGGKHYSWVASPFGVNNTTTGLGGEDSDIASASAPNSSGHYNVYAASLWVGSTTVAISQDGGKSWTLDPLGGIPVEDRPWIAADGACTFYVTYHQLPTFDPIVNRYDICNLPNSGIGVTINPTSSTQLFLNNSVPGLTNDFGKIAVDTAQTSPFRHNVYVPMMGCDLNGPTEIVQNAESTTGCVHKSEVFLGVSNDAGKTFTDYKVAEGTNGEQPVWCCNVGTDRGGTVYFVWSDNHNAYLARSKDGGKTWLTPVKLNKNGTAVYPTVAGGSPGNVSVAFYGAPTKGDANDAKVMGDASSAKGTRWTVQVAHSTDFGRSFSISTATSAIHTGQLCTSGSSCSAANSRNLLDDFGIAISPKNGAVSMAYTSDQPGGTSTTAFTGYASLPR